MAKKKIKSIKKVKPDFWKHTKKAMKKHKMTEEQAKKILPVALLLFLLKYCPSAFSLFSKKNASELMNEIRENVSKETREKLTNKKK